MEMIQGQGYHFRNIFRVKLFGYPGAPLDVYKIESLVYSQLMGQISHTSALSAHHSPSNVVLVIAEVDSTRNSYIPPTKEKEDAPKKVDTPKDDLLLLI